MPNTFSSILAASPDSLKPKLPLPAGVYVLQIIKAEIEKLKKDYSDGSRKAGDEILILYTKPVAPQDVDETELEECENWRGELLSIRIFPDEMGDTFCDMKGERGLVYDCGLNPSYFSSTEELIGATVGQQLLGTVIHRMNKDNPERPFVNIKGTAPV